MAVTDAAYHYRCQVRVVGKGWQIWVSTGIPSLIDTLLHLRSKEKWNKSSSCFPMLWKNSFHSDLAIHTCSWRVDSFLSSGRVREVADRLLSLLFIILMFSSVIFPVANCLKLDSESTCCWLKQSCGTNQRSRQSKCIHHRIRDGRLLPRPLML